MCKRSEERKKEKKKKRSKERGCRQRKKKSSLLERPRTKPLSSRSFLALFFLTTLLSSHFPSSRRQLSLAHSLSAMHSSSTLRAQRLAAPAAGANARRAAAPMVVARTSASDYSSVREKRILLARLLPLYVEI